MAIYTREKEYIRLLTERAYKVEELSRALYISEPTVRRDVAAMKKNELVECKRGLVSLKTHSPDVHIPSFIREQQNGEEKREIARRAAALVRDGMVIMLDASTTALCLVPHLASFKNIIVITSGARTALALASYGISTVSTGGRLISESYSDIGGDAERTLNCYNADIAFFSCHALTSDGLATDTSIEENEIRKVMIKRAEKTYLLCDKSKIGKKELHVLCHTDDISGFITN